MLAYVHHFSPFIFQLSNGLGPRWYGFAYVLAFVCGYLVYRHLARCGYSELKPDQVSDFITWAAVFGVFLGGRLGYFLFYQPQTLLQQPLVFFRVWEGGMASHGGILGLFFYTLWYARRHRISWTGLGDNLVVVAPLGLFFGRVANFINGELYGRITTVPWAIRFPRELEDGSVAAALYPKILQAVTEKGLAAPGSPSAPPDGQWTPEWIIESSRTDPALRGVLEGILNPRHPSQIYEALLEGVVLFLLLWVIRTRCRTRNGVLTGVFFIAYAVLRIVGEQFREPDAPMLGALTRGQFLSIFLILIGAAFLAWSRTGATRRQ